MSTSAIGSSQLPETQSSDCVEEQNDLPGLHRLWRRNHLAFSAAMVATPLVFRALLVLENGVRFRRSDAQGIYADICASTAFVLLAVLAGSVTRFGVYAMVTLWCVGHYANYENVRALGAMIQVENAFHLGDGTFLAGSALVISRPGWLAGILATSLAAAWYGLRFRRLDRNAWKLVAAAAAVFVFIPFCRTFDAARWRETSYLFDNVRALCSMSSRSAASWEDTYEEPAGMAARLDPLYRADLRGKPRLARTQEKPNVLLVVIEGISGAHIESIRNKHGVACSVQMPNLSRLCEENLVWTQFVTHNRQTNRGLWALLAGTYDGMTVQTTARMTDYSGEDERRLLPHILRAGGYQTAFLQAAPLGFMQKDRFMPRAGFDRVMGDEVFAEGITCHLRTKWGPDDRTLFEKASQTVDELQAKKQPWFVTVLTAGTHHPFALPKDYNGPGEPETFDRAAAYADMAVGEFIERLKKSGALENTLVLITSDESAGLQSSKDELLLNISQNWGFLVAITPEKMKGQISELFMQSDVSLSILDYLGLADQAPHFGGRSVFREYRQRRPIFIANHYFRQIGVLDVNDTLQLCRDDWTEGRKYKLTGDCLFGATYQKRPYKPEECEVVKAMAFRTSAPSRFAGIKRYELANQQQYTISDASPTCLLFGGQFLSVKPATVIKVDLDLEVVADENVLVDLDHRLAPHRPSALKLVDLEQATIDPEYVRTASMLKPYVTRHVSCFANGGRFRLSYNYFNVSDDSTLVCEVTAAKRLPGNCQIRVRSASLELVPLKVWQGPDVGEGTARMQMEKYSAAGWKNLQDLCRNGALDLTGASIDDAWLKHVARLTDLQELSLDRTQITDEGLKFLRPLACLRRLSLDSTKVTDAGLIHLRELPHLYDVSAKNTQVSESALKLLNQARPNTLARGQ